MSIMSLVQENLKKRNKVKNFNKERHVKLLNILFSSNKQDVLNLNNNVDAEMLIKLAPSWDLINHFEIFKSLGLNDLEEMKLFKMIESKTVIQNEEDRNWLISVIPNIKEYPPIEENIDTINLNHLKIFYNTFFTSEENDERYYLSEFLSNKKLNIFTDKEITEILSLIKDGNNLLGNKNHLFTFILEIMNDNNFITLLKQYLDEDKDKNSDEISLESFEVLAYLNNMNIQNIDLENLKNKSENLKNNSYLYSSDFSNDFMLKPFIPYYKEGNDINSLNEDFLFNLNKALHNNLLKEIIVTYQKNKTFQKTMREFLVDNHAKHYPFSFFYNWFVDSDNVEYHKLINVNQLTVDELHNLMKKQNLSRNYEYKSSGKDSIMSYLGKLKASNEVKNLTNKEIILHIDKNNVPFSQFIFDNFKQEKVDIRITLFKFLTSMSVTKHLGNQEFMDKFNSKIKTLKNPINIIHFYKEFESKKVDKETAFSIYILKTKHMDKLIDEALTEQDFVFILKNRNQLNYSLSLLENKKEFIKNSELIKTYFEKMNISEEFKMKYFERILEFYQEGNVESTMSYLINVSSEQQIKNIGLLVKAELAGKLNEIKYNKEDLRKELASNISDETINKWVSESFKTNNKLTVKESSDFKTLFEMGENPTRSCMSYSNGAYNECLLSIFDGNKKLITVYEDDKLIGRAILRLTKITDEVVSTKESSHLEFGFRDVETDGYTESLKDDSEKTVLFLERLYTSYTGNQLLEIITMMFDLVKEKANEMGLPLFIANGYSTSELPKVETNMFISHSKNGKQYLDSLGGSANSSVGGTYKHANIYKLV